MRIGPRCNSQCSGIVTGDGHVLAWVECVRYSDVYCVRPIGSSSASLIMRRHRFIMYLMQYLEELAEVGR